MLFVFLLTECGFISVAKFVTDIFLPPQNAMRNVNVILKQNSQLNKTAVISRFFSKINYKL